MATSDSTQMGPDLEKIGLGGIIPGSYTITLKPDTAEEAFKHHIERLDDICQELGDTRTSGIKYGPKSNDHIYNLKGLKGYSGTFTPEIIEKIKKEPTVECISHNIVCGITPNEATEDLADPSREEVYRAPVLDHYKLPVYASNQPIGSAQPFVPIITSLAGRPEYWNLGAISHSSGKGNSFVHDPRAGRGVDIYVIDTGIKISHTEFTITDGELNAGDEDFKFRNEDFITIGQGVKTRASYGRNLVGQLNGGLGTENADDDNGHGTQVAGVAGGKTAGVARRAALVSVKVLGQAGLGDSGDIAAGINWATGRANETGRPAVFVLSLSVPAEKPPPEWIKEAGSREKAKVWMDKALHPLSRAVTTATEAGYLCCAGAGNDRADAKSVSPAKLRASFTVGAARSENDKLFRCATSNYGPCVNIWAPGENIRTAHKSSNTAMKTVSGTSLANPHVAGVAATVLARNALTSQQLRDWLMEHAKPRVGSAGAVHTHVRTEKFLYNNGGEL